MKKIVLLLCCGLFLIGCEKKPKSFEDMNATEKLQAYADKVKLGDIHAVKRISINSCKRKAKNKEAYSQCDKLTDEEIAIDLDKFFVEKGFK